MVGGHTIYQSYQVLHHSTMLWDEVQNSPLLQPIQSEEIKSTRYATNNYLWPTTTEIIQKISMQMKFKAKFSASCSATLLRYYEHFPCMSIASWNMEGDSSTGPSVSISLLHLQDILSWYILVYAKQHLSEQCIN